MDLFMLFVIENVDVSLNIVREKLLESGIV